MNFQPKARRFIIFFFGTFVLAGVSVFIWLWVQEFTGDRDFRVVLLQIDLALEDGEYERARSLSRSLIPRVTTPRDGRRLIKRGYQLLDSVDDQQTLGAITQSLVEKYPGNEDIIGYRTNYLLEIEKPSEAAQISSGLESPDWLPYKIEAYLKGRIPLDSDLVQLRLPGIALPLAPSEYSDPNALLQAWTITSDSRYLTNAILLLTSRGKISEALTLLESQKSRFTSQNELLLFSMLSFDARGGEAGIVNLAPLEAEFAVRPELYRFLADYLFEVGQLESASGALGPILRTDSAMPQDYVNRSRYFRHEGDWAEAEKILLEGLERFPQDHLLTYALLAAIKNQNQPERLREFYSPSLGQSPNDPGLRLAGILIDAEERGYTEVLPQLWQLVQDFPDFEGGWRNLFWVLWMIDDRQGLSDGLQIVDPGNFPWIRQFESLSLLRQDNIIEALQVGAALPPRSSLSMYSVPGLRAGLGSFDSPEAERLFVNGLEKGVGYIETPERVREYLLYLGSWLELLRGNPQEASYWYEKLAQNYPRSVYSTRLRYWTGSER